MTFGIFDERVALISGALVEHHGEDAITVADQEALKSTGGATQTWQAVVTYLSSPAKRSSSDRRS